MRQVEYPLERAVTNYIGSVPLLWVTVNDPPAVASDRGVIEAGAVALLSNFAKPPIDPPSSTWLGRHADREAVRRAGL